WHNDRRHVYAEFLGFADEWADRIDGRPAEEAQRALAGLYGRLGEIRLLANSDVQLAAVELLHACTQYGRPDPAGPPLVTPLIAARDAFLQAARVELGLPPDVPRGHQEVKRPR